MSNETTHKASHREPFQIDEIPWFSRGELAETRRQFERGYRQFMRRRGLSNEGRDFRGHIDGTGLLAIRLKKLERLRARHAEETQEDETTVETY